MTHTIDMRFGDLVRWISPGPAIIAAVRRLTGVLLLVFGIGKAGALFMHEVNWRLEDPVLLWIPHNVVMVGAAAVEVALGIVLMLKRSEPHSMDHTVIAWVGCLVGYQLIRSFYQIALPCRCLGLWQQWLGLSDSGASIASLLSLGLLGFNCLVIGLSSTLPPETNPSWIPSSQR